MERYRRQALVDPALGRGTTVARADVSHADWSAVIEPGMFVPEIKPDTREYNSDFESYQVGFRLRRSISGARSSSAVVLWFGNDLSVESWSSAQAEAARIYTTGGEVAVIVWPLTGSVSGFHNLTVTGAMAGRRLDQPFYFGRSVTLFSDGALSLIQAASAVSVFARLEHGFSPADPGTIIVDTSSETDTTLHCPTNPSQVLMDGSDVAFS